MVTQENRAGEMLVLGAGTGGARVAYYLMQRGGLPKTRLLAVDTDGGDGEQLPGLERVTVPAPPALPVGAAAERACIPLKERLDELLPHVRMLVVLAFSGGNTGVFYGQFALGAAKAAGVPATALLTLPHTIDDEDCQKRSRGALEILHSQGFPCLALDCGSCGRFFPDTRPESAYLQAVRWAAETTIGYLRLFTEEHLDTTAQAAVGKPLAFGELPRGIFAAAPPVIVNGRNLDVPTFLRLQRKE